MKKKKNLIFIVTLLLALIVWDLSKIMVVEAATGQITVTGRIGETVKKEEEADDDKKQTIVADVSQFGQRQLPQTGSSNTFNLKMIGYVFLLLSLLFWRSPVKELSIKCEEKSV